jgi:hypothetical protein
VCDLTDKKITQAEINAVNVKSEPGSRLHGTVQENKNVFDRLAEFIAGRINEVLDVLSLEGAGNISFEEITGLVADTVQDAIAEFYNQFVAHRDDKDNPHDVTSDQVASALFGDVENGLSFVDAETANLQAQIDAEAQKADNHIRDYNNPHRVRSDQVSSALYGNVENGLSDLSAGLAGEAAARINGDAEEAAEREAADNGIRGDIGSLSDALAALAGMFGTYTWGEINDLYPTWQDVLDNCGTWLNVLVKHA